MAKSTESPKGDLIKLWPVTILTRKFDQSEQVNPELITLFTQHRNQHQTKPGAAFVSADNFAVDMQNPALDSLKTFIVSSVGEIAQALNYKYWEKLKLTSVDIDVTGMWYQISNGFSFHETHIHGNCSWSGVYYVQSGSASKSDKDVLPNGMLNGVTRFYGPHTEYCAAGHGDWGNFYLQDDSFTSYPEDGQLVIFPSHLKHMAFPYQGEKDRIIVSFHAQVNSEQSMLYNYSFN